MWANHNWIDIHPAGARECREGAHQILYPGPVTRQTFETLVEHTIQTYFKHPSYWLIDGPPYYSIYDLPALAEGLRGVEATRDALSYIRARAIGAGFPDLHLNQVLWNSGVLPGEREMRDPGPLLTTLGFSSFTSYVWIHHVPLPDFPETDYKAVFEQYLHYWETVQQVQVIGVPDVKFGEELMAWVQLKPGASVSEEELKAFCRGQIAHYKIPRYFRFVDAFPMTVTGKIQKFRMREISIEALGLDASMKTA